MNDLVPKNKDSFELTLNRWSILYVTLVMIALVAIGETLGIMYHTNQPYTTFNSLLNLSVHTTLFNSSVFIAPAFNATLCGIHGCANYSHGSNRTFIFNISNAGYLYITSSNGQNLTVIASETYAPPIPYLKYLIVMAP